MRYQSRGFTLMELVLVTTISAIILSLASPYLGRFISNQKLLAAARTVQLEAMYARAVAISEQQATVLCPSSSAEYCENSSNWHTGWIIFQDKNADRERQPGEALIRVSAALEGVKATSSRFRRRIRFLPNGTAAGTAMSIIVCPKTSTGSAQKLVIANSGRIRQERSSGNAAMIQCGG